MTIFYLDYENGSDSNGGTSWADAWKTFTNGATAARIAPGDVIRIAKSPAPVSVGNATWTNNSNSITFSSPQTKNIDMCETAWTANPSGDTTCATQAAPAVEVKEGSNAAKFTFDSSVQTNTLQAYKSFSETDFSAYQKISFNIDSSSAYGADALKLCLCSDAVGAVVIDTLLIPASSYANVNGHFTVTRSGGGNLGSSIQSIALYTAGTITGLNSNFIILDDIIACTSTGISLTSLISKNSADYGGTELWYRIQSINDSTVLLGHPAATPGNGRKYPGTTETVTTYHRATIDCSAGVIVSSPEWTINDSGSASGGYIEFLGGYNTATTEQDGQTIFDGHAGICYGIYASSKNYLKFSRLGASNYQYTYYVTGGNHLIFEDVGCIVGSAFNLTNSYFVTIDTFYSVANSQDGVILNTCNYLTVDEIHTNSNNQYGTGLYTLNNSRIGSIYSMNNGTAGAYISSWTNSYINYLYTSGNILEGIIAERNDEMSYIKTAVINETNKVARITAWWGDNFGTYDTLGYAQIYTASGIIQSQPATAGGTGIEWKMSVLDAYRDINYPIRFKLAEVAVASGYEVTAGCYIKKSHATDIGAKIICTGGQLLGVESDVTTTAPTDTNRNLVTIVFTPQQTGVFVLEALGYWVANTADENIIFDDIVVTQA